MCVCVSKRCVLTNFRTPQNFANCVWLIIITMTTVGYGDEYPTTFLGRIVSIMASITAVIMLAVTINLVISKVINTPFQCCEHETAPLGDIVSIVASITAVINLGISKGICSPKRHHFDTIAAQRAMWRSSCAFSISVRAQDWGIKIMSAGHSRSVQRKVLHGFDQNGCYEGLLLSRVLYKAVTQLQSSVQASVVLANLVNAGPFDSDQDHCTRNPVVIRGVAGSNKAFPISGWGTRDSGSGVQVSGLFFHFGSHNGLSCARTQVSLDRNESQLINVIGRYLPDPLNLKPQTSNP